MLLIEDRLEAARSHLAAGRTDNAALLLESILDVSPANVTALRELAAIKLRSGDLKKAQALAGEAASRAAGDPDVLSLLATTALVSGEDDRAAAALDQALAVDPFHPETCRLKAAMLVGDAEPHEAERLLQRALEKHPSNPDLLAALSSVYMEFGLARPALERSQQALAAKPDEPELLALVGSQLGELGDHEKAIPFFERGHLLDPGNPLFLIRLADSQLALGELAAAHRTAKRAISLFPNLLAAWASYANVMTYRGEAAIGLREFAAAARQHPDRVTAALTVAAAHRIAGDPEKALRLVEPVARQSAMLKTAQRAQLLALMRDCCLSLGMFDQVAATFPGFEYRAALGLPPGVASTNGAQQTGGSTVEMATEVKRDADLGPSPDVASGNGAHPSEASTIEIAAHAKRDAELAAAALGDFPLIVEGKLSILETVTLLRFRLSGTTSRGVREIRAPASLEQIVALMENTRFKPTDIPVKRGSAPVEPAFPLSFVLALPEVIRGGIADRLPYLHAPQARREIWSRSLADLPRPLVALAWDSNRPGILLDDYRPVLEQFEGTLVSVMWDESRHQLASWRTIVDAGVHFSSLADLAAVISEVDATIGPDGLALHFAGAMGRRAALLSMPNPPWYWFDREGSAEWYPAVSVIKSDLFGNWQERLPDLGNRIGAFLGGLTRDTGGE